MKAYLINSVQIARQRYPASTEEEPSIIDLEKKEFSRLEAIGAVRKPTEREEKLARNAAVEDAEIVDESDEETDEESEDDEDELRAEYERLFDAKPGNMKPETIKKKIAEKQAENDNLGL